jgi:hypothetical protein
MSNTIQNRSGSTSVPRVSSGPRGFRGGRTRSRSRSGGRGMNRYMADMSARNASRAAAATAAFNQARR